ncbi:MAG TPA: LacI family DNA-binding transcriptional regulator [Lacisediminihabitans sp.]|uniref:LacI family DNA-binding transcriptional regulator n=1 Tax=Lacisediminihabitans sp. TaxID=2787631 RepID=UPI002ED8E8AF
MPRQRRPTIADIAAEAGVSKMAVSFALGGRPGVSEDTRERIRAIADRLGWQPNSAARSLSAARAGAVGLVLARPATDLGTDTFYMQLLAGLASELSDHSTAFVLQVAADLDRELEIYTAWAAQRRVDAVLVTDLRVDDPRPAHLASLGLPAVVPGADDAPAGLRSDDAGAMDRVLDHLTGLGHVRIARVTGPHEFQYTQRRGEAFVGGLAARGLTGTIIEASTSSVVDLMRSPKRPTAIVFDTDLLAVTGTAAIRAAGFAVPHDVSIVAWDGSLLVDVIDPPLTSLKRDVFALGRRAATELVRVADGGLDAPDDTDYSAPHLRVRGSSGPPPPEIAGESSPAIALPV